MLCPDTSLEQAMQLAEQMRACVAAHRFAVVDSASSSFGVAVWRKGDVADSLVKRVDDALYRAKQNGRNRVCPEAPTQSA
jgi:diguanylate cyclase (GGDEF)-like protein